jgi:D-alanyl-D-alanine carboxypeptidase
VDEGLLGLDDPLTEYLPEFGLDPRITVRMMLQHTSGLFNYTGEPNPDGTIETGIPLYGNAFEQNRFRTYRPADLVAVALAKPAVFEPGTSWSYSNTNYILAGLLIERLTGQSYATQVRERILRPLGLRETILPGTSTAIPGPHAHGYYTYRDDGVLEVLDVAHVNPSWSGSAGEIISTTRDLDRFLTSLLRGRLLPPALLSEMREQHPLSGYGLGLETIDAGPECGGVYEGHTGGMHGYQSFLFSNGKTRLVMSVTTGTADIEDPAVAERVSAALNTVILTAACGAAPPAGRSMVTELALTA